MFCHIATEMDYLSRAGRALHGFDAAPMSAMMKAAMENGLYLSLFSNVVRLTPPLNISEQDLHHGLKVLDKVLAIGDDVRK